MITIPTACLFSHHNNLLRCDYLVFIHPDSVAVSRACVCNAGHSRLGGGQASQRGVLADERLRLVRVLRTDGLTGGAHLDGVGRTVLPLPAALIRALAAAGGVARINTQVAVSFVHAVGILPSF